MLTLSPSRRVWRYLFPADGAAFFDNLASTPPRPSPLSPRPGQPPGGLAARGAAGAAAVRLPAAAAWGAAPAPAAGPLAKVRSALWKPRSCNSILQCCHAFILAVPGSPKEAPIIDGPPGEGEEGLQKLLFVANYAGAVDAAIEVRAELVRGRCWSPAEPAVCGQLGSSSGGGLVCPGCVPAAASQCAALCRPTGMQTPWSLLPSPAAGASKPIITC